MQTSIRAHAAAASVSQARSASVMSCAGGSVSSDRTAAVDDDPNHGVDAAVVVASNAAELVGRDGPIERPDTPPRREDDAALRQVVEHAGDEIFRVGVEVPEHLRPRGDTPCRQEVEHGLPQRLAADRRRLAKPRHLALVAAKREPEHVHAHLSAHALAFELRGEVEEVIRHVSEGCAGSAGGGELGHQHRRLPHDGIDEQLNVRGPKPGYSPRSGKGVTEMSPRSRSSLRASASRLSPRRRSPKGRARRRSRISRRRRRSPPSDSDLSRR